MQPLSSITTPAHADTCSYIKLLLMAFCGLLSLTSYAQVIANFTASSTSACPPQVINFTNTSTGATSYTWNLGNSSTPSFSTNAGTTYTTPGTYTVTLTANNGTSTNTKSILIVIHSLPVVSFTASDTVICPGSQITFNNTTNPVSAGGATYYWDFGDGNSSTSQNATHTYQSSNYYTVTLTATNSDGCTNSLAKSSYIRVRHKPMPVFYLNSSSFCSLPATAVFTNQATGNGPLSYAWAFGDGGISGASAPAHTYSAVGVYTVKEIVTDMYGCKDSISVAENITSNNIAGSFIVPDSACINLPVTIVNNTTGAFISNTWLYGDGNIYTGNNPGETYTAAGTYTIKMVLYNGNCYDTVTHNIKIKAAPSVTINTTPAQPCPAPVTIQFTTTGGGTGTNYKWYFGDGDSSTAANPAHLYNTNDFFMLS
jgi:PKD repeat protein